MGLFPSLKSKSSLRSDFANRPVFWLEWLLLANIAFLGVDVFIAHMVNSFSRVTEWVPVVFSGVGALVLLGGRFLGGPMPDTTNRHGAARALARLLGLLVGGGAVVVGVTGMVLHLGSGGFAQRNLKGLVYAAPFSAPLAYVGLGLLLILDRKVESDDREWSCWVVFLALGGALGNYLLCLIDHAANGFFQPTEWIGVIAGAVGVGTMAALLAAPIRPGPGRCSPRAVSTPIRA